LFLYLKDFAIELEIKRDFYRDMIVLSASSQNSDKFSLLDQVQKLYNNQYKTSVERLIEGYKKEFGDGKNKEVKIRLSSEGKKKVNDLIKNMPTK
jgi:hypothetical protein